MDENTKGKGTEEELEEEDQEVNTEDTAEGGSGGSGGAGDESSKNTSAKGGKKGERSFTQSQVKRMMTREKNQGRAAAYKEIGIDPNDSKMVKMFQAFVESQKTDDQKAAEKEAEARRQKEEAERKVAIAEAKAEAMMLGVKSQYVEDAVTLALSKLSEDNSDLKTILSELKEKYGLWFEAGEEEDDDKKKSSKTGQKGTGSSVKDTKKKGGNESAGLGARLAAQRKTGGAKTSYWGGNR